MDDSELGCPAASDEQLELALGCLNHGDVDVKEPDGVELELLALRLVMDSGYTRYKRRRKLLHGTQKRPPRRHPPKLVHREPLGLHQLHIYPYLAAPFVEMTQVTCNRDN